MEELRTDSVPPASSQAVEAPSVRPKLVGLGIEVPHEALGVRLTESPRMEAPDRPSLPQPRPAEGQTGGQ